MPPTEAARAVCRRGADYIKTAAEYQHILFEARIDTLDDGADACFLKFVVPAWLQAPEQPNSTINVYYRLLHRRCLTLSWMDTRTRLPLRGLVENVFHRTSCLKNRT